MRILLCIAFLFGLSLKASPPLIIGLDLALSGTLSPVAVMEEIRNGVWLAQGELNKRPGAPFDCKIVVEDNMGTPRGSNSAAQKLISVDKVDALMSVFDYATSPVVPLARSNKVPHVGFSWGVKMADNQYNFLTGSNEISFARALHRTLKDAEGPVALVCVRQASIPGFADEMSRLFKEDGKTVPTVIFFNTADVDFRQVILKLQEAHAKHVVLMAWGDDLNKFFYQYRLFRSTFTPTFYSIGLLRYAQDRSAIIGAVIAGNPPLPDAFVHAYKARFGFAPGEYAAFGYDTCMLIAQAVKTSKNGEEPLRERIARGLSESKSYKGVCGVYTNRNGVFDLEPILYKVTADAIVPEE